jgi:protein-tyrosine sulfotransferase
MSSSQRGNRLILVGGAARSGTTLIQNMLDCHPDILGGPEFLHLKEIVNLRKQLFASVKKEWIDLYCSCEQVDAYLSDFIDKLLLPLADQGGKHFLSEKTPDNTLVFPQLAELLPGAHFIQIIRDPRAVIASMLEVGRRSRLKGIKSQSFTRNVRSAISYIRHCYNSGAEAAKIAPDRFLTVTYERLVSEPEPVTRDICQFLGLEWSPEMLSPGEKKHLGEKAITQKSNEIWYTKKQYYKNPEASRINKWEETLSPLQLVTIQKGLGHHPAMSKYGYNLSVDRLPMLKRLSANIGADGYRLLRRMRSGK